MSGPRCAGCGRVHVSDMSVALGRFNPDTPTTYRANYNGSPIRPTRAEADNDKCEHIQGVTK